MDRSDIFFPGATHRGFRVTPFRLFELGSMSYQAAEHRRVPSAAGLFDTRPRLYQLQELERRGVRQFVPFLGQPFSAC